MLESLLSMYNRFLVKRCVINKVYDIQLDEESGKHTSMMQYQTNISDDFIINDYDWTMEDNNVNCR